MHAKIVLITGEQGFLGSRLIGRLHEQFDVFTLNGDVTDREYCLKRVQEVEPDVIVHLAALSLPKQCDENPAQAKLINVGGTKNMADAATTLNKSVHFIFASTAQVYDYAELSKGLPVTEKGKINPQNLYAKTKRAGEVLLQSPEYRKYLKVTVLRLFNHVHKSQQSGTFMSSVYSQIQELLKQDKTSGKVIVGDLELQRELNPVQVLTELLVSFCALSPEYTCEVFNVCSGQSRKLESVAKAFGKYFDMALEFERDPQLIRENDPKMFVGSNEKIKNKLALNYPEMSDMDLVRNFCADN